MSMHVMRSVYKVKIIKVNICLYLHLYMYVWDQWTLMYDIHLSFFITTPFSSWKCYKLLHCLLFFPIFTFMPACKVVKNLF